MSQAGDRVFWFALNVCSVMDGCGYGYRADYALLYGVVKRPWPLKTTAVRPGQPASLKERRRQPPGTVEQESTTLR